MVSEATILQWDLDGMGTAMERDQADKKYVVCSVNQQGKEFWAWSSDVMS